MKLILALLIAISNTYAISYNDWTSKSLEEKYELFYSKNGPRIISLSFEELAETSFEIKEFILNLERSPIDTFADDSIYGLVGGVKKSFELFISSDHKIIGATIVFIQQGCSHMDEDNMFYENSMYYETIEEANDANCFDNDVSWTGRTYYDENNKVIHLYSDPILEWTGH